VDESDTAFVVPYAVWKDDVAYNSWFNSVFQAREKYCELVDRLTEIYKDEPDKTLRRKKARQEARSVLPNATETKIFVTGNARSWRNFIEQRASVHAEREIRCLANKVLSILRGESPNLFGDYRRVDLDDGTFYVETNFRKV
jgi:thymidylate synthase (FAD)